MRSIGNTKEWRKWELLHGGAWMFLCMVFLVVGLAGCRSGVGRGEGLERFEFSEAHMGTMWNLQFYAENRDRATAAAKLAFDRVNQLEEIMTDYDPGSELIRLGRSPVGAPVKVSDDLLSVLVASGKIVEMSHGVFDPTAGSLIQVWRRARRQREYPESERIRAGMEVLGWTNLMLNLRGKTVALKREGIRLDLGGIAKGYAADAALKVLKDQGYERAMVSASGDFAIGAPPPGKQGWLLQVGSPVSGTDVLDSVYVLKHVGVSTSGDTEQYVELGGRRFSHIVDPRTGLGLTNRIQATVIAESATRSDALATAVCILGVEEGAAMIERDSRLSALMVVREGERLREIRTRRFPVWGEAGKLK